MPESGECHTAEPPAIRGRRASNATTIADIVDAAKEEFSAHGFDGTTVDSICRRARVSKQLLYYYFGSKSDLYTIILKEAAEKTAAFIACTEYAALAPEEALKQFMHNMFREFVERPQIVRMTIDEAQHAFAHVGKTSPLAAMLRTLIDEVLRPIVERGCAEGIFRADCDADQLFWVIHSLVTTWFAHSPMIALVTRTRTGADLDAAAWRASSTEFVLAAVRRRS
ncbi:TetR/AcrR family transcriptional regulator [Novosphingobium sp. MMS21-SN21R]|uniref:TetR/AcrR family transcriptional regulator n=1 Tax=Novosphingobium sp. MMS21-SN21R TaxID=2969298 RepID=UPI00288810C1|nr:TetR/AcrR family transcriptional regulator [Novosphingobium sp. MMS21-SN21R]MDT0509597.1 TetR/AcrR family transcriptional regulator [Novosphingobium sp. MMS21-SN21R]